jgi:nicotinamidase-related amidase
MEPRRARLERQGAALLVVDIQERLCQAMNQQRLERLLRPTHALLVGAEALGLPVVVTEQYPKGLGATLERVRAELPAGTRVFEKTQFSCALPAVIEALGGRKQVLLCGMETHVCVFQTARDLIERGFVPFLCADALLSRDEEDKAIALELCRDLGAVVTTSESALFDLLGCAGTPEFKLVSRAVK